MMTKNVPRRQHYLPQGYLRGFTDAGDHSGKIRTIDLLEKKCFTTSTENVAHIRDFYVFDNVNGNLDFRVETEIFRQIDDDGIRVIRELQRTHVLSSTDDWDALATFVAFLHLRVPQFRQISQELSQHFFDLGAHFCFGSEVSFASSMNRYESETGESLDLTLDEARSVIQDSFVDVPRTNDVKFMLEFAPELTAAIRGMTPRLLFASGRAKFLTGDSPVCLFDTDSKRRASGICGVGWKTPEVEVSVPLSSDCCLVLDWNRNSSIPPILNVSDLGVANYNLFRAGKATQYLFFNPITEVPFLLGEGNVAWGEEAFLDTFAQQKQEQPAIGICGGPVTRRPPRGFQR